MSKPHTKEISIYLEDVQWIDLRYFRSWLEKHDASEAATMHQIVDKLWHGDTDINWRSMPAIKQWLMTIEHDVATKLYDLIEHLQDRVLDTDVLTPKEIYGWEIDDTATEQTPKHLKLVVSNYFRPLERIDQPAKPDPVLTLV
jgi:hypothetical protein